MKKVWKIVIGVGVILAMLVFFLPKAKSGSEIAALLKPVISAENQSMDVDMKLMISGKETNIHTTIYMLTEDEKSYLVMEQDGHSVYMIEDVLYLENGAAFLIYDEKEDVEIKGIDAEMFTQIAALYEALEITTTKEQDVENYMVTVSGEEAKELLRYVMPDIYKEMSEIDSLKVELTAKDNVLTKVSFSGGATVNGKEMSLELSVDNFKTHESGEYVIPEEIHSAVQNVKKEELFCITKDLYRLMVAFADLASQETVEGKVKLSVNCGAIHFTKTYDLTELETNKTDLENADEIENLPDMISLLCMEGDIGCVEENDGFRYTLKLNKKTMEEIAQMILPQSVKGLVKLSKGNVEVVVNEGKINSMELGIAGTMQSLFSKVQSQVGAEFIFE